MGDLAIRIVLVPCWRTAQGLQPVRAPNFVSSTLLVRIG
jgi:hypothetical protein